MTKIVQGAQGFRISEICLHTSATSSTWWLGKTVIQMRDEIRIWHTRDRGWRDIGYHFVVAPDGSIAEGRKMNVIGAGVEGRNRGVIHICMVPLRDVTKISQFEDWYSPAQFKAVRKLIGEIRAKTDVREVTGHNQYANKLCPGFKVDSKAWLG